MSTQEQQTKPDGGASVSTAMLGAGQTTKWKISPNWKDEIEPIEVISETACFVTARIADWTGKKYERRMRKDGSERIFDTFEAAKEALIENSKQRVRAAEAAWQREKDRLKKRNDIKAPNAELSGPRPLAAEGSRSNDGLGN